MSELSAILTETPTLVVGHVQGVCVAIPRSKASPEGIAAIRNGVIALAKSRTPASVGLLFYIAQASDPPAGETRTAAREMFQAMRPHLTAFAALIEGSGFAAAAKRSVFTWATGHMLGDVPVKTFRLLDEASAWLVGQCRTARLDAPDGDALSAFVRRVHRPAG